MSDAEEVDATNEFLNNLGRFMELVDPLTPYAIRIAISSGLAQQIADGEGDVASLAAATGLDPEGLASLMAHLVERGVVVRDEDGAHGLSAVGAFMVTPDAQFYLQLGGASAAMDQAWAGLGHTLSTGEPGYDIVHGKGFWEHLNADKALGANFDEYMRRSSTWTAIAPEQAIWPEDGRVVDVGGGDGRFLSDLLAKYPNMVATLVELPDTAKRAAAYFAHQGIADRVDIAEGSFFDELPDGGDVYVLGHILHDWPDAEASTILRRVRDAAGDDGRLIIVEQILDRANLNPVQSRTDLLMRVLFGSKERTHGDWDELASASGWRLADVHDCDGIRMLIEFRPA